MAQSLSWGHSSFHEARKKIIYLPVALLRSGEGFRKGLKLSQPARQEEGER